MEAKIASEQSSPNATHKPAQMVREPQTGGQSQSIAQPQAQVSHQTYEEISVLVVEAWSIDGKPSALFKSDTEDIYELVSAQSVNGRNPVVTAEPGHGNSDAQQNKKSIVIRTNAVASGLVSAKGCERIIIILLKSGKPKPIIQLEHRVLSKERAPGYFQEAWNDSTESIESNMLKNWNKMNPHSLATVLNDFDQLSEDKAGEQQF